MTGIFRFQGARALSIMIGPHSTFTSIIAVNCSMHDSDHQAAYKGTGCTCRTYYGFIFISIFISCTLFVPRTSTLLHFIAYASRSRLRPAIRRVWYMDEADKIQPNEKSQEPITIRQIGPPKDQQSLPLASLVASRAGGPALC